MPRHIRTTRCVRPRTKMQRQRPGLISLHMGPGESVTTNAIVGIAGGVETQVKKSRVDRPNKAMHAHAAGIPATLRRGLCPTMKPLSQSGHDVATDVFKHMAPHLHRTNKLCSMLSAMCATSWHINALRSKRARTGLELHRLRLNINTRWMHTHMLHDSQTMAGTIAPMRVQGQVQFGCAAIRPSGCMQTARPNAGQGADGQDRSWDERWRVDHPNVRRTLDTSRNYPSRARSPTSAGATMPVLSVCHSHNCLKAS